MTATPARAKQLAPRPDGLGTHFTSPRGETCRQRRTESYFQSRQASPMPIQIFTNPTPETPPRR